MLLKKVEKVSIYLLICDFWAPSGSRKGPIKQGLSFPPLFRPSCRRRFLGILSFVLSNFRHSARNSYEVVTDRGGFSGENFLPPKIGKMDQKWTQDRVFSVY